MSVEDVAAQLKLPAAVVDAMEQDNHAALGPAVFARGRLKCYAELVGVPTEMVDGNSTLTMAVPPELVSRARSSRVEQTLRRFARQGIYVVLTATIVLPVIWLATHNQLPQSPPVALTALDRPTSTPHDAVTGTGPGSVGGTGSEARDAPPVVASIAPFSDYRWTNSPAAGEQPDGASDSLQLRFSGDSWVDIVGIDGRAIEHGPVEAGSVRNYRIAAVARVTIGNPGSVVVLRNGEPVDLKAFQNANTTRFTLSADGKPVQMRD